PARPGPRVTAIRPTSSGLAFALSKARSSRWGRRSRWSRAASSGTTPPKSLCRSTCEWMTLARTLRPPSTSATEVSSQDVSMPSVSVSWTSPSGATRHLPRTAGKKLVWFRQQIPAKAADVRFDPLQVGFVCPPEPRRVDRVRPHDDGVLTVVRVVALAPTNHFEAEVFVHVHRVFVGRADLERYPLRAHV